MEHDPHPPSPAQQTGHSRPRLIPFFRDILKKDKSTESEDTHSSTTDESSSPPPENGGRKSSVNEGLVPIDDGHLVNSLGSLHTAILDHVTKFYCPSVGEHVAESAIQLATAGMPISSGTIMSLLRNEQTRLAALGLCISWTILSRGMLCRLRISSTNGSTFLPPEIVECFQSFSVMLKEECDQAHFVLLSRWKQITATLMYSFYVRDSFSTFDSRTFSIERALNDLDLLLRAYAHPPVDSSAVDPRLVDLRQVLQAGARFAFTLFGTADFWFYDWGFQGPVFNVNRGAFRDPFGERGVTSDTDVTDSEGTTPGTGEDVVVWPALVRLMDGEGRRVRDVLTKMQFLSEVV